jgi:hypothetical protein
MLQNAALTGFYQSMVASDKLRCIFLLTSTRSLANANPRADPEHSRHDDYYGMISLLTG